MLGSRVPLDDAVLLDLFAGSGALGIEALSRGAAMVTFVEQDATARRALTANLAACAFAARGRLLAADARTAVRRLASQGLRFDGIFLDPPYGLGLADRLLDLVTREGLATPESWAVAEHATGDRLREAYGCLRLTTVKRYGNTTLSLFIGVRTEDGVAET